MSDATPTPAATVNGAVPACAKCGGLAACWCPTPAADGEPWVIWSHEHRAYWRAERRGYCDFLIGAGVYSEEEAKAIATEVSRDPSKQNEARSLASELARAATGTIGAYLAHLTPEAPDAGA